VSFNFSNLVAQKVLRFASLQRLQAVITAKYQRFLRGEFSIRQVIRRPIELAQFACSVLLAMSRTGLTVGFHVNIDSQIPIGCGMGSSAAIILAIIYSVTQHCNLDLSAERLLQIGREIENLQHGYSSGLDLRLSQQGGCLLSRDNIIELRPAPKLLFYVVNTGQALSTTGECVAQVAPLFNSAKRKQQFAWVTTQLDQALQDNNQALFKEMIQYNQRLLVELGVVPRQVQNFIAELVASGGVAKISGAGAIAGDQAGILLVLTADLPKLIALCATYNYKLLALNIAAQGVHIV
jgi:mevalonate kinase